MDTMGAQAGIHVSLGKDRQPMDKRGILNSNKNRQIHIILAFSTIPAGYFHDNHTRADAYSTPPCDAGK